MNFGQFLNNLEQQNKKEDKIKKVEKESVKSTLILPSPKSQNMSGAQIDIFSGAVSGIEEKYTENFKKEERLEKVVSSIHTRLGKLSEKYGFENMKPEEVWQKIGDTFEFSDSLKSAEKKISLNEALSLSDAFSILKAFCGFEGEQTQEAISDFIKKNTEAAELLKIRKIALPNKAAVEKIIAAPEVLTLIKEAQTDEVELRKVYEEFDKKLSPARQVKEVLDLKQEQLLTQYESISSFTENENKEALDLFEKELARVQEVEKHFPKNKIPNNLLIERYKIELKIAALQTGDPLPDLSKITIKDVLIEDTREIEAEQLEKNRAISSLVGGLAGAAAEKESVLTPAEQIQDKDSSNIEIGADVEVYSEEWLRDQVLVQRDGGDRFTVLNVYETASDKKIVKLQILEGVQSITLNFDDLIQKIKTPGSPWSVAEKEDLSETLAETKDGKASGLEEKKALPTLSESFDALLKQYGKDFEIDLFNLNTQTYQILGCDFTEKEGFEDFVNKYKDLELPQGFKLSENPSLEYINPGFSINDGETMYNHPHNPSTAISVVNNTGDEKMVSIVEFAQKVKHNKRMEALNQSSFAKTPETNIDDFIANTPVSTEDSFDTLGKDTEEKAIEVPEIPEEDKRFAPRKFSFDIDNNPPVAESNPGLELEIIQNSSSLPISQQVILNQFGVKSQDELAATLKGKSFEIGLLWWKKKNTVKNIEISDVDNETFIVRYEDDGYDVLDSKILKKIK